MKLFGLFFNIVIFFSIQSGRAIKISKHVKCLEAIKDTHYNGNRCTVDNITLPEISYNWGSVTHSELHFANSIVPFFPDRLVTIMKQFVVLNMTGVQLKMLTPENLREGSNLKDLYLRDNQLTILMNQTFNESVKLEILDISFNDIEIIQPGAFDNLKNLKELDLRHNCLVEVGLEFQELVTLLDLDLSYNAIQNMHLDAINSLTNIDRLNLENNFLTNLRVYLCNEFNLQLLLANNSMESIVLMWNPMTRMGQENKLEIIAPHNRIVRLATDSEINLIHVDLQHNNLSSIKGMKNMKQLSKLNLAGNKINEVNFEMLSNLTNLRELNISFNMLSSLDVTNICEKLPNLQWLGLKGNMWESCEFLSDIVSVLRASHIQHDMIWGEGELSCVVIETDESTEKDEKDERVTTDRTPTNTTQEPLPTTPINKDKNESDDDENYLLNFLRTDFLRLLAAVLLILGIIAVIVRICVDCKCRKGVDLSSASYANGGTRM